MLEINTLSPLLVIECVKETIFGSIPPNTILFFSFSSSHISEIFAWNSQFLEKNTFHSLMMQLDIPPNTLVLKNLVPIPLSITLDHENMLHHVHKLHKIDKSIRIMIHKKINMFNIAIMGQSNLGVE